MSDWRPGDRRADSESMLRVDQAGEYGATRIYAGQMAVLRGKSAAAHEIARTLGISQGTVKSTASRALVALERAMQQSSPSTSGKEER